tara:strand:- start:2434 stop:3273 length:840 start_codon:yes stop_codon:yes gene_type:complete
MEKDIAIVYMVAGISSRFGGKIKQFAKVGLNNETLIECSLNQAIKSGATKIIFIVGNKTEKPFKEMFGNNFQGIPIFYALQNYNQETRDRPWGTTDALCSAKNLIDCSFIVCNGDDIYGENTFKILIEHLKNQNQENPENQEAATIGYKLADGIPEQGSVKRGIFKTDEQNHITEIKETFEIEKSNLDAIGLTLNSLCSMNIFALHPKVINLLTKKVASFKQENTGDRKVECLLPNDLSNIIQQGKIKIKVYPTPDKWLGVTNPEDEETVRQQLALLEK